MQLPTNPEVAAETQRLAAANPNFGALKKLVGDFADKLIQEKGLHVDRAMDTRFFPREDTIRYISRTATGKARWDKVWLVELYALN
jgi:hypothetical protein